MRSRIIAVILSILFIAGLTAGCRTWTFLSYKIAPSAPSYSGTIVLKSLKAPVTVTFDEHAVPHITAQNEHDLFFTVGYLHARERLFQMDLLRRISQGRMAELFGNHPDRSIFLGPDLLAADRWYRVLGLEGYAEQAVRQADDNERMIGEAYVDGINTFIKENKPPIEFELLGVPPQTWTLKDAMSVARLNGWMLSTNLVQELIRYLFRAELGEEEQRKVYPPFDDYGPYIIEQTDKNYRKIYPNGVAGASPTSSPDPEGLHNSALALLKAVSIAREQARVLSSPEASNNWALAPSRTKSGKPILANDPHLSHLAPSVFYAMQMTIPDMDVFGVTLPGAPVIVLGRNRDIAWAATTTYSDTQDIYLEKVDPSDPTRYLTPEGPKPFKIKDDVIIEKLPKGGYAKHPLRIRYTSHGPILNDAQSEFAPKDGYLMAARTSMEWESHDLKTMVGVARAKNVDDFVAAFQSWGVPVQNWMVADRHGRIGYYPAGKVPKRHGWDGTMPVPGWTGEFEWDGWIPFNELPQLFDPPSGMIVTANNKVVPQKDYPYPFTFDATPGYRASRIVELLGTKNKWTAEDIAKVQTDVYVKQADRLLPSLLAALDRRKFSEREQEALDILRSWDRYATTECVGASLFFATHQEAWNLTLKDDLSPEFYNLIERYGFAGGFFDRLWAEMPDAKLFDRKETKKVETRDDILFQAFTKAVENLRQHYGDNPREWTWGRIHTLTYAHPFGAIKSLQKTFNVGPFAHPGSRDTVWAAGGRWTEDYRYPAEHGPVFRQVADLGDPKAGGYILDLGESGWPATKFYSNAQNFWSAGALWPISFDEKPDPKTCVGTLKLTPK